MEHLPNPRITFEEFHVVAHASKALDETRRIEQKTTPGLKGLRWVLLRDYTSLGDTASAELDALLARLTTRRTARAWVYREQLREILDRKQINIVSGMLWQWCTNVMRSKVEPMKEVARLIRNHFEGIIAWAQTRQTNGFLEGLNGLFQSAKRRARGYGRFSTIRTVIFLLAGFRKRELPSFRDLDPTWSGCGWNSACRHLRLLILKKKGPRGGPIRAFHRKGAMRLKCTTKAFVGVYWFGLSDSWEGCRISIVAECLHGLQSSYDAVRSVGCWRQYLRGYEDLCEYH